MLLFIQVDGSGQWAWESAPFDSAAAERWPTLSPPLSGLPGAEDTLSMDAGNASVSDPDPLFGPRIRYQSKEMNQNYKHRFLYPCQLQFKNVDNMWF